MKQDTEKKVSGYTLDLGNNRTVSLGRGSNGDYWLVMKRPIDEEQKKELETQRKIILDVTGDVRRTTVRFKEDTFLSIFHLFLNYFAEEFSVKYIVKENEMSDPS